MLMEEEDFDTFLHKFQKDINCLKDDVHDF
jgi:hypothetical protein